ncbi:hypothetical protein ABH931_000146 [Streptacidiphilus sp. MAP12-33]|uniref:hypothetical protein n=1 Tax=Streptacidiphilus sp. MAP12-33 TaxID=3156266 RepID=UPI0035130CC8
MRTAQELAAMTYEEVSTAQVRWEISLVEVQAWFIVFDSASPRTRRLRALPESIALANEIKALPPNGVR